jgi:hypothetical protein
MDKYIVRGNLKISGLELLANPSKMIKKKPENTPEDKILLFRKLISEKLLTYIPNKSPKDKYDENINIMWQLYNEEKNSKEDIETQLESF